MSEWSVVVPEATTNLLSDPQFALADPDTEWTIAGDGTSPDFTRETDVQFFGTGSAQADVDDGTYVAIRQSITVTAQSYTLSARVRRDGGGEVTSTECRANFDTAFFTWDSITELRDGWYLCVKTATATAGSRDFGVRCNEDAMHVDAVQLEAKAYRTTYCDGEQPGCSWDEEQHASTSTRDAESRAGGKVVDFDDYDCYAELWTGTGMPPVRVLADDQAITPGTLYQDTRVLSRPLILTVWAKGTSLSGLHSVRQDLLNAVKVDRVATPQVFKLRYSGSSEAREIGCVYEAGLEGGEPRGYTESVGLRLLAPDPFWYSLGEVSAVLDEGDTATARLLLGWRDEAWNVFGPPDASGTYTQLYDILVSKKTGRLYVGGNFVNWDNVAQADYIARWNPLNETWSGMGSGGNGNVLTMAEDAAGNIYAGGNFSSMGGVANTDKIAYWNGSTWVTMGDANGTVNDILCASDGKVYATGSFTTIGGSGIARIAYWDGSAWNALGSGLNTTGEHLAEGLDGSIYVGGNFTTTPSANRIAKWDGSSWSALGTGLNGLCRAIAIGDDGTLYAGGDFTTAGGSTVNYVAAWNGTAWTDLDSGTNNSVYSLAFGDGVLYAGGVFTQAGDVELVDRLAMWNGTVWSHVGADLPGSATVYAIHVDGDDFYLGFDTTGTATYSGTTTVTPGGTRVAYPRIEISRSGGTTATLAILRNATTGKVILADMDLQDGEKITLDLAPGVKTVESSIYRDRLKDVFPQSDLGSFALRPGANTIILWVQSTGTPTIEAFAVWRDTYWSTD